MAGNSIEYDETVDVIVAGSGGGVTGAYTAAREGLSVALLEAGEKFGGTTSYSGGGGMWFPCNAVLRRAGSDDTIEAALTYFHAVVGDRTPRDLQETYVRGGAALIDYLEADDDFAFTVLPWPDYYGKAAGPPRRTASCGGHTTAQRAPRCGRGTDPRPLDNDRLGTPLLICWLVDGHWSAVSSPRFDVSRNAVCTSTPNRPPRRRRRSGRGRGPAATANRCGSGAPGCVLLAAYGFRTQLPGCALPIAPGRSRTAPGAPITPCRPRGGDPGGREHRSDGSGLVVTRADPPWRRAAFALWFTGGIFVNQFDSGSSTNRRPWRPHRPRDHRADRSRATYAAILDGLRRSRRRSTPIKANPTCRWSTPRVTERPTVAHRDTIAELAADIGVPATALADTVARTKTWSPPSRFRLRSRRRGL